VTDQTQTAEQPTSALANKIEHPNPQATKADQLRQTIYGYKEHFALALTGADGRPLIAPEKFARAAFTAVNAVPLLAEATLPSMMGALLGAAQLGLEPGPLGQIYLVPFKDKGVVKAQLIIGYQGLVELAYRSGRVMSLTAHVIREKDEFDWELGSNAHITHRPSLTEVRGEIVGAYAIAVLAGGGQVFDVLNLEQIASRRGRSKATGANSPWQTDYEAMCRKSAVRQLFKWLPSSVENQMALGADGGVWRAIPAVEQEALDPEIIDVEAVED
jgi:recombination protein RecT